MQDFASLWNATDTTLAKVVWAFFIGIIIASFVVWYSQRVVGLVVRRINAKKIHSPENAKTLKELGTDTIFIRNALKKSDSSLRKTVYCTSEKAKLTDKDFEEVRFYVPEKLRHKAHYKYKATNTTLPVIIIGVVVMFIVACLAMRYIPKLLEMLSDIGGAN